MISTRFKILKLVWNMFLLMIEFIVCDCKWIEYDILMTVMI